MSELIRVEIIGAPIACKEGLKDSWREVAEWAGGQLRQHFEGSVTVQYFDLFDPGCPSILPGLQLPVVMVNDEVLSNGDKISIPMLRRKIEAILEKKNGSSAGI